MILEAGNYGFFLSKGFIIFFILYILNCIIGYMVLSYFKDKSEFFSEISKNEYEKLYFIVFWPIGSIIIVFFIVIISIFFKVVLPLTEIIKKDKDNKY